MAPIKHVTFGDFRLDSTNECLWRAGHAITLRPKAYRVLQHLVAHPGQLVTKQQLLEAVWPGTFVGDAVLKVTVKQIREALGDAADSPRYIETSHRRGYRFIGPISDDGVPIAPQRAGGTVAPSSSRAADVLGRDVELAKMRGWLERALRGERQIVFVTGEAGIGKTTLVNALLEGRDAVQGIWTVRGQCLEQYGAGEAYLPVLDGLSRLGRTAGGEGITALLRQHAPAWLLELPSLIPAAERETLQQRAVGATRERMLREMAEAIEAMAAQAPLILVLEDLHWSDYSTLDLVAYLARRRDPARLMVIGTYRPVDVILSEHPLKGVKRELQAHSLCHELPLEYLTEEAIDQYLASRCPRHELPKRLTRLIHRRTEGNPLFMVNVVQYLIDERVIVQRGGSEGAWTLGEAVADIESGVPENVKQLIEKQIERLSADERRVLEGASVVGMECSCVAIAAGLDEPIEWVEERCEALVRRHQFLAPAKIVDLPDGTITPRYKFSHVLYLEVPYRLLPPMRRAQIHGRIGRSGEAIYGERVGEIAAELAMHFEQARDCARAATYLLQAAENATSRSAQHEAAALARRGLQALDTLPDTPDHARQELSLRMILGVALMATRGFAAAEVEPIYKRALELCAAQDAAPQAFMVQWMLGLFHYFRAEMAPANQIAARLLELAAALPHPAIVEAHRAMGVTLVDLGRFSEGLHHLDQASALYATPSQAHVSFAGQDPKVVSECFAARALWALGYPDRAVERMQRGLALAKEIAHPESLVIANHFAAHLHQLRGEAATASERAETVIALADEYGLELWAAFGHMNLGWAKVEQGHAEEGIQELQRGLAAYEATGARLWRAHFLGLLAQALAGASRIEDGLTAVTEALTLVRLTSDNCSAAELHRIHGELLMTQAADPAGRGPGSTSSQSISPAVASRADACFGQALDIARQQKAKSWELRAVTSLGHLYQRQARRADARRVVRETYDWFTEGHETADLQHARAALE